MSTSLLEIVDRGDEARIYIMDNSLEVAKAMIQAGIQAAAVISEQEQGDGDVDGEGSQGSSRVLH